MIPPVGPRLPSMARRWTFASTAATSSLTPSSATTPTRSVRRSSAAVGGGLLLVLRRLGEVGTGVEDGLELLPRLLALGRVVLGRPVALVGPVPLEHPTRDGCLVDLVDTVGDAHRRRRRVHGLDGREIGGAERAED